MNRHKYILIVILLLQSCSPTQSFNSLSFFVLGSWHGEFEQRDGNKAYEVQYNLSFLPFHIFLYDRIAPDEAIYNVLSSYRFIEDNRIIIEGRLIDESQISRDGDALIVDSVRGFPPDGRYTRVSSIWDWLLIISIISIIAILMIQQSKRWLQRWGTHPSQGIKSSIRFDKLRTYVDKLMIQQAQGRFQVSTSTTATKPRWDWRKNRVSYHRSTDP